MTSYRTLVYLNQANRRALQEVADALHAGLSPTARHLMLIGLEVERRRLGLPPIDTTQPVKSRRDADALGVPTRSDIETGAYAAGGAPKIRGALPQVTRDMLQGPVGITYDQTQQLRADAEREHPYADFCGSCEMPAPMHNPDCPLGVE